MQKIIDWKRPEKIAALPQDEVAVYLVDLTCKHDLMPYLSVAECDQSKAFKFNRDRNRYVIAHGALRLILSQYLDQLPREIKFDRTERGKPYLRNNPQNLQFNLSHSGDYALIAVTQDNEVGVDIELMRKIENRDDIANRFFSCEESAAYLALPADKQHAAFYHIWTQKEAVVKTTGQGIAGSLKNFSVSVNPLLSTRLTRFDGENLNDWTVCGFIPEKNYKAAVAWCGREKKLSFWRWLLKDD